MDKNLPIMLRNVAAIIGSISLVASMLISYGTKNNELDLKKEKDSSEANLTVK
jgi:hypothetical protein